MEWWVVIALVIAILVILFPAAYVWNLNIGGIYAANKRAREKRAAMAKEAPDMKMSDQGSSQRAEMTRMRRAAFGALFFLVAISFPVLIWVALFVAIRDPLLRAMKRAGYAALFFLVGISMPVLIWVGFVVAIRKPLVAVMRRIAYATLFLLVGVFMPILIWVAFAVAIREPLLRGVRRLSLAWYQMAGSRRAIRQMAYAPLFLLVAILMPVLIWVAFVVVIRELSLRWRESRLPSALVCRLDTDCPPGYLCVAGRCVPQY